MNYLKHYLIAFSLLMGCNFSVYGVNSGFDWDNQALKKVQIEDINHYIPQDEQQSMIKMLASNKIVSQNANALENEVSLCVLDANPQDRLRQPLKHVLCVKKDGRVVAACLKGDKTSSDSLSSCVRHIIGKYKDIPIHICGSWGKEGDEIPFVSLQEEDLLSWDFLKGGHLYFCSTAARVGYANATKVFFDGKDGVLDLYENQEYVKTNAKKVTARLSAADTRIECDDKKAYINLYHGGGWSYDSGPVHLVNHQGKVTVSNDGFITQTTGKMGTFKMNAQSRVFVYDANSSEKFEINDGGIAIVVNSDLGEIKAQRGGYMLLINSTYSSKTESEDSTIRQILVDPANFANNVIIAVYKEILKQYSNAQSEVPEQLQPVQSEVKDLASEADQQNNKEEFHDESEEEKLVNSEGKELVEEMLGLGWDGVISDMIKDGVEKQGGLQKEKRTSVLGKRTYSQQFQCADEEFE